MPNNRHKKSVAVTSAQRRGNGGDVENRADQARHAHVPNLPNAENGRVRDIENRDPQQPQHQLVKCCVPVGCDIGDLIAPLDPDDSIRVICNNEQCDQSRWMHHECFESWQEVVLAYLRSCGRARSWSEKQRLQNLWTKKGYDLAYKACDCKCGRGHLRKDLDYFPKESKSKKRNKKKSTNDKPMPVLSSVKHEKINHTHNHGAAPSPAANNGTSSGNLNGNFPIRHQSVSCPSGQGLSSSSVVQPHQRVRHLSLTSTGSSPPTSIGSPATVTPPSTPCTPTLLGAPKKSKFDFFADAAQAASGNIFKKRDDFNAFSILPRHKQNPYHIKMEDDGPHGNDETRCFILSHLSTCKATSIACLLCKTKMPVFDRYPLIDGTFFVSPLIYDQDNAFVVQMDGKTMYLQAVCMHCLEGGVILRCGVCGRRWDGSTLLLGTMYSYDIFAATPCCQKRLSCKHCHNSIIVCGLQFYSEYSRSLPCPCCKIEDYHFVKPLQEIYIIQQPSICK